MAIIPDLAVIWLIINQSPHVTGLDLFMSDPYNARPLEIGVGLCVRLLLTGLSDKALIFGVIFHGNDQPIGS